MTLVEPKIVLEINAEGKPNWEFAPSVAEARPAAAKPSSPKPLSLGRLTVENGTLIFSDSKAGLSVAAEKANFTASVGSIDGPYSLAGGATINGAPLKIDLAVSAKGAAGHAVDVALEAGGGKLSYKGALSELGPAARLSGTASASADNLVVFAETLLGIAGQPRSACRLCWPASSGSTVPSISRRQAVAARDFKLVLGEDNGSGSFALTLAPSLAVEARFTAARLDLDRWLAAIALPERGGAAASRRPPRRAGSHGRLAGRGHAAAGPRLAGDPQRQARARGRRGDLQQEARPRRGPGARSAGRRRRRAEVDGHLPGDLVVQAKSTMAGDPSRPTVSGDFSLVGPKLRETLAWLAVDVSSIPANKLTQLSIKGHMGSSTRQRRGERCRLRAR